MNDMHCQLIESKVIEGILVDIYGCYDENTNDFSFEFYDVFVEGECINEGNPLWIYPDDFTLYLYQLYSQ